MSAIRAQPYSGNHSTCGSASTSGCGPWNGAVPPDAASTRATRSSTSTSVLSVVQVHAASATKSWTRLANSPPGCCASQTPYCPAGSWVNMLWTSLENWAGDTPPSRCVSQSPSCPGSVDMLWRWWSCWLCEATLGGSICGMRYSGSSAQASTSASSAPSSASTAPQCTSRCWSGAMFVWCEMESFTARTVDLSGMAASISTQSRACTRTHRRIVCSAAMLRSGEPTLWRGPVNRRD